MHDTLQAAHRLHDWLRDIRRDIHRHPESGFREERTASLVQRHLTEQGIDNERVAGTGVLGLIRGRAQSGSGRCVALRADIDALPIADAKTGDLRSEVPGLMHACGHDAHTACLLGAARLIAGRADRFSGTVKLLFQPAEETDTGGAMPMIEAGVLENPHVDTAFGLHVDPGCEAGKINVVSGCTHAASDMFDVVVTGRGAHGAYPHLSADPLYAACQCISTLQSLVSRNAPPLDAVVLTVGMLHAGEARNVIPAQATFRGILRTLQPTARETAKRRFREIAEGVCRALDTKADITVKAGYPVLRNDERATALLRRVATDVLGAPNVLPGQPSLGVEDFAYFAERVPACFFCLGTRNAARDIVHPLHSDRFDIDEDALPVGAAVLAEAAIAAAS